MNVTRKKIGDAIYWLAVCAAAALGFVIVYAARGEGSGQIGAVVIALVAGGLIWSLGGAARRLVAGSRR